MPHTTNLDGLSNATYSFIVFVSLSVCPVISVAFGNDSGLRGSCFSGCQLIRILGTDTPRKVLFVVLLEFFMFQDRSSCHCCLVLGKAVDL